MDEDNFKISSSTLAVSFVMPCIKKCSVFSVFSCFFYSLHVTEAMDITFTCSFLKGSCKCRTAPINPARYCKWCWSLRQLLWLFAQILSSSKDRNLVLISAVFAQLAIYGLLLSQKSYPLMLTFCSGTNMTHFLSSQKAAQIVFEFKKKKKSKE